jgi:hypothetical protein
MTAVLGDFLRPAGENIAAAVAYRGDLADPAVPGVARELTRVIAALGSYLGDLALPDEADPGRPGDAPVRATLRTRLDLHRSALALRDEAWVSAQDAAAAPVPLTASLAEAADQLAAGHDLLLARRAGGQHAPWRSAAARAGHTYWAALSDSEVVTAALLAEVSGHARALAPWAARLSETVAADPHVLALHAAARWLYAASGTSQAWQLHRSLPPQARDMLYSISVTVLPPRRPPAGPESMAQLCAGITGTCSRLCEEAVDFGRREASSLAASSASWRRDALGLTVSAHASSLILRSLAERAAELGAGPTVCQQLRTAHVAAQKAWPRLRAISRVWDTFTTGPEPGAELSPVAREIDDLVLRIGRLAYRNPAWAPGLSQLSPVRSPDRLAPALRDILAVIGAIHRAADAILVISTADRQVGK